jgi:hypothetical protein
MAQKNLMAQVAGFLKRTTTGELPAPELALLSEEDLQRVVGGVEVEGSVSFPSLAINTSLLPQKGYGGSVAVISALAL